MAVTLKQPSETMKLMLPFAGGAVVAELLDVAAVARGLVADAPALQVTGNLFAGAVNIDVSGGGDGERYLITGRARMADDQECEAELEIAVIDLAWTMPDGGAPYLTIEGFVRRFGLDEVVRMTDDGTGRIDRDFLVSKLIDAQALVDAHLATRYQLPLTGGALVIEMAIADLARARLYRGAPPEGVADAAKIAMRTLERIQSGQLSIAAETAVVEQTSADPILFAPGQRQYPSGLRDY